MKNIVSVSLGSSKRDHRASVELMGERFEISREGVDGKLDVALARVAELDHNVVHHRSDILRQVIEANFAQGRAGMQDRLPLQKSRPGKFRRLAIRSPAGVHWLPVAPAFCGLLNVADPREQVETAAAPHCGPSPLRDESCIRHRAFVC